MGEPMVRNKSDPVARRLMEMMFEEWERNLWRVEDKFFCPVLLLAGAIGWQ